MTYRTYVISGSRAAFKREAMKAIDEDGLLTFQAHLHTTRSTHPADQNFTVTIEAMFREPLAFHAVDVKNGDWYHIKLDESGMHFDVAQ